MTGGGAVTGDGELTGDVVAVPARPARVDRETHDDVEAWLFWEAELLDARRFHDWLSLLADDVHYRMPVSVTLPRSAGAVPGLAMHHFDEDRYALEKRVERLEGDHAWTEDPPSRARRHVSNVRVVPGGAPGEVVARSYVLMYRSRGDDRPAELLSAERTDRLRGSPGNWLLVERDVAVDDSVLRAQNLALFL